MEVSLSGVEECQIEDDLNTHSSIDPLYELLNVDYGKVEM